MNELAERARIFAAAAHDAVGQTRKYTGIPYWLHPWSVAQRVQRVRHTQEMLAAAYLHDVLEDTKVRPITIGSLFGDTVLSYVDWLTDASTGMEANRATRKEFDRQHIAKAPACVKTIKLADLIDNSTSILTFDPNFAKVYLPEKKLLLQVLREGDPILWNEANDIVEQGIAQL
ncbi:HD domain-containing protein [Ferrovibrio terrae]|uniref:HD domain-containing protein n=1 Tax=Ferrovibrio terrae TaxID=2594003 RepID=UPI003137BF8C